MDLDQWADLDPSIFKQQLIDNYDTDEIYVVDIYNSLIQKASHAPSQIAMLAETAAELFGSLGSLIILFKSLVASYTAVCLYSESTEISFSVSEEKYFIFLNSKFAGKHIPQE